MKQWIGSRQSRAVVGRVAVTSDAAPEHGGHRPHDAGVRAAAVSAAAGAGAAESGRGAGRAAVSSAVHQSAR